MGLVVDVDIFHVAVIRTELETAAATTLAIVTGWKTAPLTRTYARYSRHHYVALLRGTGGACAIYVPNFRDERSNTNTIQGAEVNTSDKHVV